MHVVHFFSQSCCASEQCFPLYFTVCDVFHIVNNYSSLNREYSCQIAIQKCLGKEEKKPFISLGVAPPGKTISEHSAGRIFNLLFGFLFMNQYTVKLVSAKAQRAESSYFLFAKYLALLK